jgi:hypothetical protein
MVWKRETCPLGKNSAIFADEIRKVLQFSVYLAAELAPRYTGGDRLRRACPQPSDDPPQRAPGSPVLAFELLLGEFPIGRAITLWAAALEPNVIGPVGNHFIGDEIRRPVRFGRHDSLTLPVEKLGFVTKRLL